MNPSWMDGPPKTILLATDLSPRADRALDRAVALAGQWQARLVVLHVVEPAAAATPDSPLAPSWRRPADPLAEARRQLEADLGPLAGRSTVVIEQGDAAEAIVRVCEKEGCGLVVTGTARNELLGRVSLGRTVDRLLRRSRAPVLVVRQRVRGPYRRIVAATDFSDGSRHAVEAAAHLFPGLRLALFHAYEPPLAGRSMNQAVYDEETRRAAAAEAAAFAERIRKPAAGWQPPDILIEPGLPGRRLHDHARDSGVDLMVTGTHGRSAVFEMLLGSVAKQIVDDAPCDVLVVREPRAAAGT